LPETEFENIGAGTQWKLYPF